MSNPSSASQGGGRWYTPEELKEALDLPTPSQGGLDLEALERLLEKATPRPWLDDGREIIGQAEEGRNWYTVAIPTDTDNRDLILAAVNGLAALIHRIQSLQRVREAAVHYRVCKSEQAAMQDAMCLHVVWNGGPQEQSCIALLFAALDTAALADSEEGR